MIRDVFAQAGFSQKFTLIYAGLLAGNIAAWAWAVALFGGNATLMGIAVLAYTLGLRHAVDADHIAAIDNVTRKLVSQGQKPTGVGLFFSLGHSTVVILACASIALLSAALTARFAPLRDLGAMIGTTVSATFLFLIAAANIVTLIAILRALRKPGADIPDLPGGLIGRLLRPLMRVISRSWQMYPLGFLFGLGFDTATQVAALGISAAQAHDAMPFWTIMVFPALFTAGMSLVDATDGILMTRVYGWALVRPAKKLVYNLTITLFSILVALVIGTLQVLNLLAERFVLEGGFWSFVGSVNEHFSLLGFAVIAAFLGCWGLSVLMTRAARSDARSA
jgi:high-affinity nickel-transport protein